MVRYAGLRKNTHIVSHLEKRVLILHCRKQSSAEHGNGEENVSSRNFGEDKRERSAVLKQHQQVD
jgi:hypothetical protein